MWRKLLIVIGLIILGTLLFLGFVIYYAYDDTGYHDAHCERLTNPEGTCNCYERLCSQYNTKVYDAKH